MSTLPSVMVVDDEEELAHLFKKLLKGSGINSVSFIKRMPLQKYKGIHGFRVTNHIALISLTSTVPPTESAGHPFANSAASSSEFAFTIL